MNYLDKSGSFLKRKAALKQYNFALKIDRTATDRVAANKGFSAQLSQLKLNRNFSEWLQKLQFHFKGILISARLNLISLSNLIFFQDLFHHFATELLL